MLKIGDFYCMQIISTKLTELFEKLLQAIQKFSKGSGYKVNIQKSKAFIHTNVHLLVPFKCASKKICKN